MARSMRRQCAAVAYRFHARDVNVVVGSSERDTPVRFRVRLDGQPPGAAHGLDVDENGEGTVTEPRLHQLVRQPPPVAERTVESPSSIPASTRTPSRTARPQGRIPRYCSAPDRQ